MCPDEGYTCFRNSELVSGNLTKACLGGSKKGLFYVLIRDHSTEDAANMMNRMTKMCTRWLSDWGFSIGIEDVTPAPHLFRKKEALVSKGYEDARQQIAKYVHSAVGWYELV